MTLNWPYIDTHKRIRQQKRQAVLQCWLDQWCVWGMTIPENLDRSDFVQVISELGLDIEDRYMDKLVEA